MYFRLSFSPQLYLRTEFIFAHGCVRRNSLNVFSCEVEDSFSACTRCFIFVATAAGHGRNSLQLFTKHYCGYKDSISVQLEGLSEAVFVAAAAGHGRGLVLAHQGRRVVRRRGRLEVSPET